MSVILRLFSPLLYFILCAGICESLSYTFLNYSYWLHQPLLCLFFDAVCLISICYSFLSPLYLHQNQSRQMVAVVFHLKGIFFLCTVTSEFAEKEYFGFVLNV